MGVPAISRDGTQIARNPAALTRWTVSADASRCIRAVSRMSLGHLDAVTVEFSCASLFHLPGQPEIHRQREAKKSGGAKGRRRG